MRSLSKLLKNRRVLLENSYCVYSDVKNDEEEVKANADNDLLSQTENAEARAAEIIEKANSRYEEKLAQAREQARQIYKTAYDAGFSEGREKGSSEARSEAEEGLARIKELFAEIDALKTKMIRDNEKSIISLSVRIAEKIVNKVLSEDDKAFVNIFENAVEELSEQKWVKLSVSEYEAEFATMSSDYLLGMIKDAERLEISVIKDAPRGTCVVETEGAIIDASAATQLGVIKETLLNK